LQDVRRQPLYSLLWPLYGHGNHAVMLFWVISGFVFSAVYVGTRPTVRGFFIQRFSRLYPLHFLTLVAMAALQAWSYRALGHFQIHGSNDLRHFVLDLLFVSGWNYRGGVAFNFPIWSVSTEIIIYWVFFLLLPVLFRRGFLGPAAAAVLFFAL